MKKQVAAASSEKRKDAKLKLQAVENDPSTEQEKRVAGLILDHRENGRKLARSILRRWRVRMPADEIDSIVDLALCEAARRYSADKGAAFMTFFFYHLRGHLVRSVARAAQASNVFLAYGQQNEVETREWQHVSSEALWSFVPDHLLFGQRDVETPEHAVLRKEKIDQCRNAVTVLDDLEKEIITRSFKGEQPLVEIARTLGYSRCHISRVKKSALERLKVIISESRDEEEEEISLQETLAERNVPGRGRPRRRSRRRSVARTRGGAGSSSKAA
jgi:RNA polymerase sigma factor (sigma-70 family)